MYYCSLPPQQSTPLPSTMHCGWAYPMQNSELLLDRINYIHITETGKTSISIQKLQQLYIIIPYKEIKF
jgi:hypothetical protein